MFIYVIFKNLCRKIFWNLPIWSAKLTTGNVAVNLCEEFNALCASRDKMLLLPKYVQL